MRTIPILRPQEARYTRDSTFSYACHACSRCCYDKVIQLNPYEAARLAQNLGMSTTEFLARYTERSGTALRHTEEGACVFLTPQGCGVHADRPLVCRLYPLGRRVSDDGQETFHELTPHPQTEGCYGIHGTVGEYVTRQGADPFIEAVDRYVEVVGRMTTALLTSVEGDAKAMQEVAQVLGESAGDDIPEWLDMDRTVARYCHERKLPIPMDMTEKTQRHIQAIEIGLLAGAITQKEERHESQSLT